MQSQLDMVLNQSHELKKICTGEMQRINKLFSLFASPRPSSPQAASPAASPHSQWLSDVNDPLERTVAFAKPILSDTGLPVPDLPGSVDEYPDCRHSFISQERVNDSDADHHDDGDDHDDHAEKEVAGPAVRVSLQQEQNKFRDLELLRKRAQLRTQKTLSMARGRSINFENHPKVGCVVNLKKQVWFDPLFAVLILANVMYLGVEAEFNAYNTPASAALDGFQAVADLFTAAFFIEMIFRFIGGPIDFLTPSRADFKWNMLDVAINFWSLIDAILTTGRKASDNSSLVRVLRTLRIVRILRVIRLFRFLRPLRVLMRSLAVTLKDLSWVLALLFGIFLAFAIIFTDGVVAYEVSAPDDPNNAANIYNFGTLEASMCTMFECMFGAAGWRQITDPLAVVGGEYVFFFIVFLIIAEFSFINLVNAIFCQADQKGAEGDADDKIMQRQDFDQKMRFLIRTLKEEDDSDMGKESDRLFLQDILSNLDDENLKVYFDSLQLDILDCYRYFEILDKDRTGSVQVSDFIEGCFRLCSSPKTIDWIVLHHDVNTQMNSLKEMLSRLTGAKVDKRRGAVVSQ